MSPDKFGKIIYEHYLFDIPKLFDLCTLYGSSNHRLLAKMVANIFDKQPCYHDDWRNMVGAIMETLTQQSLRVRGDVASMAAVRLDSNFRWEWGEGVVLFSVDHHFSAASLV